MKFIYLITIILFSVKAFCQQSISGKVINANRRPLKYATVELKQDTLSIATTSTDTLGNFNFVEIKRGKFSITVSYLNYETRT